MPTEVVGLSCTFPGPIAAHDVPGFWRAAHSGANVPSVVPHSRWAIDQYYSPVVAGEQDIAWFSNVGLCAPA